VLLFIKIIPAPHSPIYRRDYLEHALAKPVVAPQRVMDPSGDVWLLRNLAPHPATVRRVPGLYAGLGPHEEERFTGCWEKLGLGSLAIDEALVARLDQSAHNDKVLKRLGEIAYRSWRTLPHDMNRDFQDRLLAIWRQAPGTGSRGTRGEGIPATRRYHRVGQRWSYHPTPAPQVLCRVQNVTRCARVCAVAGAAA